MKNKMSFIIRTSLVILLILNHITFSLAQTASLLPNGMQQYFDNDGNPLTSGTVDYYIPNTSTRKNTWINSGETIVNTNPVILDAAGRAIIYGDGNYRQVLKDQNGNLIWDQLTSSTGSGGGSTPGTGDGDLVGTIKPWAGIIAPNQYAFSYGQQISRTTYAALLTAITQSSNVICTSLSNTLTGLADTTQIPVGAAVEVSCMPAGSTVVTKTNSSITLSNPSNVSLNAVAVIFPYGDGDGSTTFTLPDLRGLVIAGNNNMGGTASSNLTSTYFGSTPNATGAKGGSQNETITIANLASHTHVATSVVTDPGHVHAIASTSSATGAGAPVAQGTTTTGSINTNSATTGITVATTNAVAGGGIAVSATVVNAGSGYTTGTQTLTVSGGTCSVQPQFSVTVSGGTIASPVLVTAGNCTVTPINPVSTTGGGGTGGTLTVIYSALPISTIQPTLTLNYIIKITPDASSGVASGVASLGGMIGAIGCGSGLTCSGNNISVNIGSLSVSWSSIIGTPTTLTGYGIAIPLPYSQGGCNATTQAACSANIFPLSANYTLTGLWTFAGANGLTVAPTSVPSTPAMINAYGITGNNILFYGVSSGSFGSPSATAATIVLADNSIGHSALIDVQALNSVGTVKDAAFGINPGFQYWDAGHEQSDIDFYGYVNGVASTGLMTISAGCIAVTNVNPNSCGTSRPSNVSPGVDASFDLGSIVASPQLRWQNLFLSGYSILGSVAIASLPSCTSAIKGARMNVTNGQTTPTFLSTVSTTGAVYAPVLCNGTNWIYG